MTIDLPAPIAVYYAAKNPRDIDAMIAPFAEGAVVKDEGATMQGRAAIRAWMEETTRKYGVSVDPEELGRDGETIAVRALVSGNFPGSPARLTYRFVLRAGEISYLEIG